MQDGGQVQSRAGKTGRMPEKRKASGRTYGMGMEPEEEGQGGAARGWAPEGGQQRRLASYGLPKDALDYDLGFILFHLHRGVLSRERTKEAKSVKQQGIRGERSAQPRS